MIALLSHVGVTYPTGQVRALRDITLQIAPGEWVFLVGPTGAGKSTLLKLLYGDVRATDGDITVAGINLRQLRSGDVPKLRRQMGIVLQDYGLLAERTVWENIAFACQVLGQSKRDIRHKLPGILERVGMGHRCDAYPAQLSGGEQQRVALARALVSDPPIVLADEPTGNLDPETGAGIMQVLQDANARGTTVIIATHDRAAVDALRRRVVVVRNGTIARDEETGGYAE